VGSGSDGVIFSSEIVGDIMYLHGLNRVNDIVRDDNGVVFLIRKSVVAMANV
jgi:hypothetical protein